MLSVQRLNPPAQPGSHQHAFHELVYVISGDYQVVVGGKRLRVDPGGSILYPADVAHWPKVGFDLVILLVQWDEEFVDAGDVAELPMTGFDVEGGLRQALTWLEVWTRDDHVPIRDQMALLQVALRHHASADQLVATDPLDRARHLLASHLGFGLTLEGLAKNIGFSRSRLSAAFQERFKISPMAYRRQCRLDRAIDLLRDGERTVAEVAGMVGFATAAHLSNLLKRERGLRPSQV